MLMIQASLILSLALLLCIMFLILLELISWEVLGWVIYQDVATIFSCWIRHGLSSNFQLICMLWSVFLYFLFFFHHQPTDLPSFIYLFIFFVGVLIDWYFDQMDLGFWREFELDTKESKMSYVRIECQCANLGEMSNVKDTKWHNLCHNSLTWQVVSSKGVMVGSCGDIPLSLITHHVGELWHMLCHFMYP